MPAQIAGRGFFSTSMTAAVVLRASLAPQHCTAS